MFSKLPGLRSAAFVILVLSGLMGAVSTASAALTDLADKPIPSSNKGNIKPNMMLLMDTSTSMGFTHMPDDLEDKTQAAQPIGYKSWQCNSIYYNPSTVYTLPKGADGNDLATPTFTLARNDYYSTTDLTSVNLTSSFRAFTTATRVLQDSASVPASDPAQAAYYYIHSSGIPLNYKGAACQQADTSAINSSGDVAAAGGGTWTRVLVSSLSAAEQQKFAIWYVYYRTRLTMTKSALSSAFAPLLDKYRIGFVTANPGTPVAAAKYEQIRDFTPANKALWYAKVFSQTAEGTSPMREGLARVGRHFAGKSDGINTNMTPDPMQYACQRNYTLMTPDGYWNIGAETVGPVGLDGATLIGNTDGVLTTTADGLTPRPIYDGVAGAQRVVTNKFNEYRYASCPGTDVLQTTSQVSSTSNGVRRSTSQVLQATLQNLQGTKTTSESTSQIFRTEEQISRNTASTNQTTQQVRETIAQNLASTSQLTRYTTQLTEIKTRIDRSTAQNLRATTQTLQNTAQTLSSTRQTTAATTQTFQATSQMRESTTQTWQTTVQVTAGVSSFTRTTTQILKTTSITQQTTTETRKSTSQLNSYNGESNTPTGSCTPVAGLISCPVITTGPTVVAASACTPATASATNAWTTTTCNAVIISGPTNVATCNASAAGSIPTVVCTNTTTGPTPVNPTSCTSGFASGVTTTCTPDVTSSVVATCTPSAATAGNSWIATSCVAGGSSPVTTSATVAVAACAAPGPTVTVSGSTTTTVTCVTNTTGPTGVASCVAQTAAAGNQWLARTCAPNNTVATSSYATACAAAPPDASNNYVTTTCNAVTTGATPVATCASQTAASNNNWLQRVCVTTNSTPVGVQTCTPAAGTSPGFINTVCTPNNTGPQGVAACSPSPANINNNWTATTCTPNNTAAAPVASCTPSTGNAGNNWLTTTCTTNNTAATPVAACTAQAPSAGNGFVTVTCNTVTISTLPVAVCTPSGPTAGNGFVTTTCTNPATNPVGVQTCTPGIVNGLQTFCNTVTTGPTGVASCIPQTAAAGNQWVTRTCSTNNSGPTAVATCNPQSPNSGNLFVTRTCATATLSGPTPVATCSAAGAAPGNSFIATVCTPNNTSTPNVASCTASAATAGNGWTTTTCPVTTNTTPRASCTPILPTAGNGFKTTTCNTVVTGPTLVASCVANPGTSSPFLVRSCDVVTTTFAPVSTCTAVAASAGNGFVETTCATNNSTAIGVASCTPDAKTAANAFTQTTCTPVNTGPTPVASCTAALPNAGNGWVTTTCTPAPGSTSTFVASCTPQSPTSGNGFVTIACNPTSVTATVASATCAANAQSPTAANNFTSIVCSAATLAAQKVEMRTTVATYTETVNNGIVVFTTPTTTSTGAYTNFDAVCMTTVDPMPALPTAQPTLDAGCSAWPCSVSTAVTSTGSSNSLADVAQYYYINDLRPDFINEDKLTQTTTALISADGSPEADRALWQHMTTFGMGLGVSGTLGYSNDYTGTGSADFQQIRSGALGWPVWPNPNVDYTNPGAYNDPKSIDDFWHASVNGRGKFFSAGNPQGVIDGVKAMFKGIDSATGAGGGLSVSNNIPVIGDNAAYITAFTSVDWTGELTSKDIVNGVVGNSPTWTAKAQLDARIGAACDNRKIYYRSGAASTLANFTWNTKACDAAGLPTGTASTGLDAASQAYFDDTALSHLSQYPFMTTAATSSTTFADQKVLAVGANLVNFLRGQRGLEGAEGFAPGVANALYRNRKGALGDIVGSVAAVVKAPRAEYADAGYAAFVSSNTNRTTTIYVGSNAGMLHAFSAATGEEKWAYVPRAVIPELHRLADSSYDVNHRFYVDGSPVVGDVFKSGAWRTILVGGLNKGGKGYYALDITNPASPQSLWEFGQSSTCGSAGSTSDCDVGLSYGKPVITKLANGVWVVLVTSGYNNTTNGGSGNGVLYVLDAVTGAIVNKLNTGAGDTTTPSGLREVNNYVANPRLDNTTLRVFGGDLLGNIWRFDINDTIAPAGKEATLVATVKDPSGTPQPITNRVQLAEVDGKTFIVAATGKLLSTADTTSAQVQSVYGFKDTPGAAVPVFADLRAASSIKGITLTRSGTGGTTSCSGTTSCVITDGWYLDLPESRERVTVDPVILGGTLVFASNTPIEVSDTSCQSGHSWLNAIGLTDGIGQLDDTGQASHFSFNQLSVGLNYLLPDTGGGSAGSGSGGGGAGGPNSVGCPPGQVKVVSTGDASGLDYTCVKVGSTNPLGRRISWREIFKK